MAEFAPTMDGMDPQGSIDTNLLVSGPAPDRLPPMLFLAALIHGILIIGITFNAVIDDAYSEAISLDVTIVADPEQNVLEAEHADYYAQANQEGSGNTEDWARPGAVAQSVVPVDNPGETDGDSVQDSRSVDSAADEVLTSRADQDVNTIDEPRDEPMPDESTAMAMEAGMEITLPLPREDVPDAAIHDTDPRELLTSVNTRESRIAPYLDRWKRKIETIGVKYFPEQGFIDGMTGSPTLEVTINSSGQLEDVVVRKSSGSRVLDKAALDILQRAAPFDPFPEAVRVDYDTLRFAYKWQFRRITVQSTASTN